MRRSFLLACVASAILVSAAPVRANDQLQIVEANRLFEFAFASERAYDDPFNEVTVDVLVIDPESRRLRVPAFWAGGSTWRFRYASPVVGEHRFTTECSDEANANLHGVRGTIEVIPYRGRNSLYRHGPIRVSDDGRHFAHADGEPFLWLADTWWMGLTERLQWPGEFKTLASDRRAKEFNVVQIVAGLYPDMPAFDPRGANEAGFPWTKNYERVRPEYFDAADRRLMYLADEGFVPCIVGGWAYHLRWMGKEKLTRHWRYLVARYGAMPVVWCAAGEVTMGYYRSKDRDAEEERQVREWSEIIRHLREVDPFDRLVTVHPGAHTRTARTGVTDPSLVDFEFLQAGHRDRDGVDDVAKLMLEVYRAEPTMPAINGEVSYEALDKTAFGGRVLPSDVTRRMMWVSLLNSGVAGVSYGANGIWQVNRRGHPYGPSPHGRSWGDIPWDEAMKLPGSSQVAAAKRLLERFDWHEFEPLPDAAVWADSDGEPDTPPITAGTSDGVRVVYLVESRAVVVKGLAAETHHLIQVFDPVEGKLEPSRSIASDERGCIEVPAPGLDRDWALVVRPSRTGHEGGDPNSDEGTRRR